MNCQAYLCTFLLLLLQFIGRSQTPILERLHNVIVKNKTIKYKLITDNKTPFGNYKDTITSIFRIANKENLSEFVFQTSRQKDLFNGKSLLMLNKKSKTFTTNNDYRFSSFYINSINNLYNIVFLKSEAIKSIKKFPDTVCQNYPCYHIKLTRFDSLINNKHVYTITELFLNTKTMLPIFIMTRMQGFMEKGKIRSMDVFKATYKSSFYNIESLGQDKSKIELSIPKGYNAANTVSFPKKALLVKNAEAPDWNLVDVGGRHLSLKSLKGKIAVLDFSGNYCGPCLMLMPVFDRLRSKYKGSNVELITINVGDSKESIQTFSKKYNINYPIYINGKSTSLKYKINGIPTIYIIDPRGRIFASFDGFGNDLEKKLIIEIDKIRVSWR